MSYADYLNRLKINSPKVIDTRMLLPDASSYTWRAKMAASRIRRPTDHVINNVQDPSTVPANSKRVMNYTGSGFGGKVQDASSYTMTLSVRSIAGDNFSSGKLQTVTKKSDGTCLTRPPASQVVNENGNADGSISGINMGHVTNCTDAFNPQTKSYFVDTIPDIKTHKLGFGVIPTRTNQGVDYAQNPLSELCHSTNTSGVAKGESKSGLVPPFQSERPMPTDFVTATTGSQTGGGNTPGSRAPKVGGAFRRIRTTNKGHGNPGTAPYVPIPYVPPTGAPAHLKINSPFHF